MGAKRAVFALGLVASWLNELYFARGRFPSAGKVEALGSGGSATPLPPGPLWERAAPSRLSGYPKPDSYHFTQLPSLYVGTIARRELAADEEPTYR